MELPQEKVAELLANLRRQMESQADPSAWHPFSGARSRTLEQMHQDWGRAAARPQQEGGGDDPARHDQPRALQVRRVPLLAAALPGAGASGQGRTSIGKDHEPDEAAVRADKEV